MLELYLQLSENQGKMYIMALQSFYFCLSVPLVCETFYNNVF